MINFGTELGYLLIFLLLTSVDQNVLIDFVKKLNLAQILLYLFQKYLYRRLRLIESKHIRYKSDPIKRSLPYYKF